MNSSAKDGGLISRAVREALGTLVSPQICEQLIKRSLVGQGLNAIPETGIQIGEWLEAGLRPEVEAVVGPDAADLVMMQLGPIAAYAAISQPKRVLKAAPAEPPPRRRSERPSPQAPANFPSDEPDRPTDLRVSPDETDWTAFSMAKPARFKAQTGPMPAGPKQPNPEPVAPRTAEPAAPAHDVAHYTARPQPPEFDELLMEANGRLPTVMAATSDMGDLEALRRYLSGTAEVLHIPDLVGLLDALDEPDMLEPIVLVDCQRPTVHSRSVAALGEDLPRRTTVVLWGADDTVWDHIDRERSPGCRWIRCSREASMSDVGSLCSMLVG